MPKVRTLPSYPQYPTLTLIQIGYGSNKKVSYNQVSS